VGDDCVLHRDRTCHRGPFAEQGGSGSQCIAR
jgi:hypothetical protein